MYQYPSDNLYLGFNCKHAVYSYATFGCLPALLICQTAEGIYSCIILKMTDRLHFFLMIIWLHVKCTIVKFKYNNTF